MFTKLSKNKNICSALFCETHNIIGGEYMYPNLRAEIARNNFTLGDIVRELRKRGFKMTEPTLCNKLKRKTGFTFKEAKAIKDVLNTSVPLEELFEEAK